MNEDIRSAFLLTRQLMLVQIKLMLVRSIDRLETIESNKHFQANKSKKVILLSTKKQDSGSFSDKEGILCI
jgi:hypothetical protein